ncbi:MAG TPA: YidC/Oxa1 family membrane protein insertase [Patescibacteria group bacterium]|nr:YidC/Oxa1 family membrane protein insertase [Patescibacteria group bacterium]
MRELFQLILTQPLYNIFVLLYNYIPDVGVVIVLITIAIRLALYPLTSTSIKSQKSLTDLQPKLEALKKQHAGDQQKIAQETMRLYRENKVNPFSSCLPLLVQLPVLIAFYYVLRLALTTESLSLLYSFVKNPEVITTRTLGLFELGEPSLVLAVLAGAAQFVQAKMFSSKRPPAKAGTGAKDENMMAMMNKNMTYFMPIMTVFIGFQLPAGLTLYWLVSTALTALQQVVVFQQQKKASIAGEIVKG